MCDVTVDKFIDWYGDGADGSSPTREQWSRILTRDADMPVTLINLFKFRVQARYSEGGDAITGSEAFTRYSTVSMPAMANAGGEFVFFGQYQGSFLGAEDDWDLIVLGSYPDLTALKRLYADEQYRSAFAHRVAACERQAVMISGN